MPSLCYPCWCTKTSGTIPPSLSWIILKHNEAWYYAHICLFFISEAPWHNGDVAFTANHILTFGLETEYFNKAMYLESPKGKVVNFFIDLTRHSHLFNFCQRKKRNLIDSKIGVYYRIYRSIAIEFFLRLKIYKVWTCVPKFDIENLNFTGSMVKPWNIRHTTCILWPTWPVLTLWLPGRSACQDPDILV